MIYVRRQFCATNCQESRSDPDMDEDRAIGFVVKNIIAYSVFDVHSASPLLAVDDTAYNTW